MQEVFFSEVQICSSDVVNILLLLEDALSIHIVNSFLIHLLGTVLLLLYSCALYKVI